jgi:ubiquinone/menaquinone biosynthesis C-methylase UbiE
MVGPKCVRVQLQSGVNSHLHRLAESRTTHSESSTPRHRATPMSSMGRPMTTASPSLPVAFFDRISGIYDTRLVQALVYRPTQNSVLAELRTLRPSRILDIGCGTGQLTARIQTELGADQVYGCDAAPGMLDQARSRSSEITWLEGTAETIPLPDGVVDTLVSTEAFHWFNQPAALTEFHRVLAPGGHIVIALVNPHTGFESRLLNGSPLLFGTGHWPDRRAMAKLVESNGFRVLRQHRVRRTLGFVIPTVVTVALRAD